MFEKVKEYYTSGLWSINRVWNVTNKKIITEEEYEQITGIKFPEKPSNK